MGGVNRRRRIELKHNSEQERTDEREQRKEAQSKQQPGKRKDKAQEGGVLRKRGLAPSFLLFTPADQAPLSLSLLPSSQLCAS
jgi:hypothetical protein